MKKLRAIASGLQIFSQYAYAYGGIGLGSCGKSLNVFFTAELPEHEVKELESLGWEKGGDSDLIHAAGSYWSYYRP